MDTLTRAYREQTLTLRAATLRDLQLLWPSLDFERLDETFPGFLVGTSALIQRDRRRVAGLASAYLRAHRMAAGVQGDVAVKIAAAAPAEQIVRSMHYTTVEAIKVAMRAGFPRQRAMESAFVQTAGSVGRIVLDAGRQTIAETAITDPRTAGWRRVGSPKCDFCKMLNGRGAVYSESTVDFRPHDHCACTAEPVYR